MQDFWNGPYYFPCVFLFKSTPVELLLSGAVLLLLAVSLRAPWRALQGLDLRIQVLTVAMLTFTRC